MFLEKTGRAGGQMEKGAVIQAVAGWLGIPEDVLVRESLLLFLQDQKRLLEAERLEILSQYGVRSAAELRERIEAGTLPEHPTWENYIELTNLENGLSRLEEQAGALMQVFPKHNPEAETPHESGTERNTCGAGH
jgi:hypothetical protein